MFNKFFSSILLSCLFVVFGCQNSAPKPPPTPMDITFVLGNDKTTKNPFYAKATNYFRYSENSKTEHVITHCHTLQDVQNYLIEEAEISNLIWEKINLVSHGNQYLGLSAKVAPKSKRATSQRIEKALAEGILQQLPQNIITQNVEINLHGCGLGQNNDLIQAVSKVFSSKEQVNKVKASPYFEYYISDKKSEKIVEKYDADFYFTNYKMGYEPEKNVLVNRLKRKYPNKNIDWKKAVENEEAETINDVFHYTFDVPVKWVFEYECAEDLPNFNLKKQKECTNWAKNNPTITADLANLEIEPEKFNWWFRKIYIDQEDGTKKPALWVKGYCTMFCVLKILPNESTSITAIN